MKFSPVTLLALPSMVLAMDLQTAMILKQAVNQHLGFAQNVLGDVVNALGECKQPNFGSRMVQLAEAGGAIPTAMCYLQIPELRKLDIGLLQKASTPVHNLIVDYGGPVEDVQLWRDEREIKIYSQDNILKPTTMLRPFQARANLLKQMSAIRTRAQAVVPSVRLPAVPAAPVPVTEEFASNAGVVVKTVKSGSVGRGQAVPQKFAFNFIMQLDKAATNRNVPETAARWVEALAGAMMGQLKAELAANPSVSMAENLLRQVTQLQDVITPLADLTIGSRTRATVAYAKNLSTMLNDFASPASSAAARGKFTGTIWRSS